MLTCNDFSGCSKVLSYFNDALLFAQIPSEWNGRKVYAILQNFCVCLSFISAISAIFTAIILSPPFFLLSLSILTISLVASYHLKQILIIPMPKIDDKRIDEMFKEAVLHHNHENPQVDQKVNDLLLKHTLITMDPENYSEQEKEEIKVDFSIAPPEPFSEEEAQQINDHNKSIRERIKLHDWDSLNWDAEIPKAPGVA